MFAIVAKERITEDERMNIREFLAVHVSHDTIPYYMDLFDEFSNYKVMEEVEIGEADEETVEFVGDWSKIMEISKKINEGLTQQQKIVLVFKIIELVLADKEISERQSNLLYYIGEAIKISQEEINLMINFVKAEDLEDFDYPNILVVDDGSGDHPWKSKRLVRKNLTGMIFFLRIESTGTYFVKYLGISAVTLNGAPLKSRRIDVFPTGSTIRGVKLPAIYYSDIVSKFLHAGKKDQISLIAQNISFKFKSGDTGLRNINIAEKGGKLVGVMGASGSGKSTLLNVLNGSETPSQGRVLINEVNIHRQGEIIEGVIGFVPQEDFLIEELTVYQNLYYAAKLCFSQYNEKEIDELVNKNLRNLGLMETKDLKVGAPLDKMISGGQRKRLNIGLELLREPTVLFVDEPTSGLSSRDSENIMDLLKELSLRGKLVFVVIHQPSSEIYKMFDSMLILDTGGYQIYYGNPVDAVIYFKTIVNMVNKDQGACPECGNINPEQIFSIIETRVVNEYGRFTEKRKISAEKWYEHFQEKIRLPQIEAVKGPLRSTLQIPGKLKQLAVFAARDLLSKISNAQYVVINLLEAPILAFFLAFLVRYYQTIHVEKTEYTFMGNDNIPVFFFMSIIVALFMGLTVSAEEIIKDGKILRRERFLHLSRGSYLSSKLLILFGISAIQTMTFVLIGDYVLEIKGMHFSYWMILFSTSCFANVLGLNISSAFNSAITIYILIPLLLIPQLVLSGVVISFDKFNPKVTTRDKVPLLGEAMTSRWAFEAAMVDQFKNNKFERIFYDIDKRRGQADYKKTYYVTTLQNHLSEAILLLNKDSLNEEKLSYHLEILSNELFKEMQYVGQNNAVNLRRYRTTRFDSIAYNQTFEFLSALRLMYVKRYNDATNERDQLVSELTATPQAEKEFEELRKKYSNESIKDMVENANIQYRIIELDNKLVQKIYPIYMDPEPSNFFDFRDQFYTPKKYFAGFYFDTLYFNITVIWFLSALLYLTLYYDVFRKIVKFFSNLRNVKKVWQ